MTTDKEKIDAMRKKMKQLFAERKAREKMDKAREQLEGETDAEYERYLLDRLTP